MRPLKGIFPPTNYPQLLVGLESPDDSAVYKISDDRAIISTMDFFPPVVDDAYDFGAIAAANALSDVYAMGGEPIMAINLVAFPDGLDHAILAEILRGGAEKVLEAGVVIAGGHTVSDKEPKYGLSVTGQVHPDKILTKGGAQVGDLLILTKALGTGVITTALKNDRVLSSHLDSAVKSMKRLNRDAAHAVRNFDVHAMTDITGYGLLGHAHEMASAGGVNFQFKFDAFRWLDGALMYAEQDIFPGGMGRNQDYFNEWVSFSGKFAEYERNLLYDPQTSGGLLVVVAKNDAEALLDQLIESGDTVSSIVGEVQPGNGNLTVVR